MKGIEKIIKKYFLDGQYNNTTELCHIMRRNNVDRGMGAHNYSTLYGSLFSNRRHTPLDLLEVGYKKNGVSPLAAWRAYLVNARIIYANTDNPTQDGSVYIFDQTSAPDISRLVEQIGKMDVIIDDAIHTYRDNVFLLKHLFGCLRDGGLYIIEDLTAETRDLFLLHRQEMEEMLPIHSFHLIDIPYVSNPYDNRLLILQKKYHTPLTIVTAASQNHSRSLVQFLCSLLEHNVAFDHLFIYDLGLETDILMTIRAIFPEKDKIHIRVFCFEKYPSFFNIEQDAGQYAWKPVIIGEVANEVGEGLLFWCDAGNKVVDDLRPLVGFMEDNSIYTPSSLGVLSEWTHPTTMRLMGAQDLGGKGCRNAAQVCFSLHHDTIRLIENWSFYAQLEDCIAPQGSDRSNHRHDQSILSILYYRFLEQHPGQVQEIRDDYFVQIHQDID